MAYGHKTGHTVDPSRDRFVPLPPELDPLLGVYVAHMGPICANGLLHAAADLYGPDVRGLGDGVRGRRVAVTGAAWFALSRTRFGHHLVVRSKPPHRVEHGMLVDEHHRIDERPHCREHETIPRRCG